MNQPKPLQSESNKARYAWCFVLVLNLLCLLQTFSPLRLNTDSIAYLSLAASAVDGHGFLYAGSSTHFPHGYPALIALLDCLGLACSWSFIGLNCLFIACALWSCFLVFRSGFGFTGWRAVLSCGFPLLSFVLIKHMSLPLSDSVFLGVSMMSMALLVKAREIIGSRRWLLLGLGSLLVGLAITVRTAGVALLPALVWAWLGEDSLKPLWRSGTPKRWLCYMFTVALLILASLALAAVLMQTRYLRSDLVPIYHQMNLGRRIAANALGHLSEWGELFLNIPTSKMPVFARKALPLLGLGSVILVMAAFWMRRSRFGLLDVYFLSFTAMVFLWPFFETRLWLPMLPLLVGYVGVAYQHAWKHRALTPALILYLVWFALLGGTAWAYSNRITFARQQFPRLYGDGTLTPTYEFLMSGMEPTNTLNSEALKVLRRYGSCGLVQPRSRE